MVRLDPPQAKLRLDTPIKTFGGGVVGKVLVALSDIDRWSGVVHSIADSILASVAGTAGREWQSGAEGHLLTYQGELTWLRPWIYLQI